MHLYIGGNIYGAGNIGDDAILLGLVDELAGIVPGAEITVGTLTGAPLDFLPDNIKCIKAFDYVALKSVIMKCDCLVCGGGTLIGEELGLSYPVDYTTRIISLAKYHGKPALVLSVGANRMASWIGGKIAGNIVRLADLVTVRDESSRQVCLSLCNPGKQIHVVGDPAYLLVGAETKKTKSMKSALRGKGKRLMAVNVVNESWRNVSGYKKHIAKACDIISRDHGMLPCFLSNDVRLNERYDHVANRETASYMECDHEIIEPSYLSPTEMIDLLGVFDCAIAMRMHIMIFAAIAGVPYAAVSRVDKVDNHMKEFGRSASCTIEHPDADKIVADIKLLLNNSKEWRETTSTAVSKIKNTRNKERETLKKFFINLDTCARKAVSAVSLFYVFQHSKFNYRLKRLVGILCLKKLRCG